MGLLELSRKIGEILMFLQNFVEFMQTSKAAGEVLLGATAMGAAFFTEMLTSKISSESNGNNEHKNTFFSLVCLSLVCVTVFVLILIIVLLLIKFIFHVVPEDESIYVLIKRVAEFYGWTIIIPFVTSILAGTTMRIVKKGCWKGGFCILLLLAVFISAFEFFVETFRMVKRPTLPLPVEAVSFIANSRLRSYPFALSGEELEAIGDGGELLRAETDDFVSSSGVSGENIPNVDISEVEYEEPDSLSGYINAIFDETYAPGMGIEDYLRKAYEYYEARRYTDSDYFNIGLMWEWIYKYFYYFFDIGLTQEECLAKAVEAYQREEQIFGGSAVLYSNMAIIYDLQGNREEVRRCIVQAIEISPSESYTLPYYKEWIYEWVGDEPYELLMEDVQTALGYGEDLSMYILYGAYAIAENMNVSQAYEFLCVADTYYYGKSAMVKILRCICADLMGQDESQLLSEIYMLEQTDGLTSAEEIYLTRYLFATNRYEELWGYIAPMGNDSTSSLNADLAVMKAYWYFKNQSNNYFLPEDAEVLFDWVNKRLSELPDESEERETLLLSRTLLQSCLGLVEDIELETVALEEASDLEYALLAVRAFNAGKYPEALQACELFFQMDTEDVLSSDMETVSLGQLEPQEQVSLCYYVQLVFAYSNFEYAKMFSVRSDSWTAYMEIAEKECEAFQQSSKSLFYIGEQFKMLQISIEEAQGKVPEESED